MNSFIYNIPFGELNISAELILKNLNHVNSALDEFSGDFLRDFLNSASEHADVRGGFVHIAPERFSVSGGNFSIDDVEFHSQKIITAKLRRAESAALFVVTAGIYFEAFSRKLMQEGDVFCGYLVDAAASEIAETATDWIEEKIDKYAEEINLKTSSRYSPGYCGWSVAEQHKLFSFLPEKFCGIELTESALMLPIKSVSGIIGIGKNIRKEEYECAVCEDENCFRRKTG